MCNLSRWLWSLPLFIFANAAFAAPPTAEKLNRFASPGASPERKWAIFSLPRRAGLAAYNYHETLAS
jgi:hypothetical protein